jgi:hypothetical protein
MSAPEQNPEDELPSLPPLDELAITLDTPISPGNISVPTALGLTTGVAAAFAVTFGLVDGQFRATHEYRAAKHHIHDLEHERSTLQAMPARNDGTIAQINNQIAETRQHLPHGYQPVAEVAADAASFVATASMVGVVVFAFMKHRAEIARNKRGALLVELAKNKDN